MKQRQTNLSLFGIIVLAWLFVGMQAIVPADGLAQDEPDEGSFTDIPESAGPHNFYPVAPCRIADSRTNYAPWSTGVFRGPFDVGQTICYANYGGGARMTPQGGNQAGCSSPTGEPGAFHVVVTSVPVAGSGHVRLWPAWTVMPNAGVLTWSASKGNDSVAVSSDSTESTDWFFGATEFCIYIGGYPGGSTHIIMDVMGYFD